MLTIYDPDVSNRPSIKRCMRLGRPQSTRMVRTSPWDQVVKYKPEGRHYQNTHYLTSYDFTTRGRPSPKINSTPNAGERGVRTSFGHTLTNYISCQPTYHIPKDTRQLHTDNKKRGIKPIAGMYNRETVQKQPKPTLRRVTSNASGTSLSTGAQPSPDKSTQRRERGKFVRGKPETITLVHDFTSRPLEYRRKGEDISNEAKHMNLFARKTTMLRHNPTTLEERLHFPYGTERSMDLNPPMRPCHHFDTRRLLVHSA